MAVKTVETITIDRLDRQLLHALRVDGRAPFRRIAGALAVSEQTIARRYRRLRDGGVVRVLTLPDPEGGGHSWLLRIEVEPAAARPLATALAARPDVAWIGLMAGGAEIACGVRARSPDVRDALLNRLPRTARVTGVSASAVMHRFAGPDRADWDGFDDPLDERQRRLLLEGRRTQRSDAVLTAEDEPLLPLLAADGRISYAELASHIGRSEAQVARRVDALLGSGALYLDIDIAAELLGFPTTAMLYLTVAPSALTAVGEELAGHRDTAFVAAVTGTANITVAVMSASLADLYRYITTQIGAIPEIQAVETVPVLERIKQAGSLMRDSRLVPAE
ncbi:MAG TPA: Lrp/AsnC family transcriptional regulator [Solirubrobacteraceae bacterium]|jgi:DNA-binding Lrp family transcriptional regulator